MRWSPSRRAPTRRERGCARRSARSRPEFRLDADTRPAAACRVAFPAVRSARDVARLAQEVFALPGRLAAERKRRVVVALDEFQAIAAFNGGSVEHALRAAVQQQRQVGYVFAGSEPSLMEQMLGPKRPFYKAGPVMRLQKIPADDLRGVHRGTLRAAAASSRSPASAHAIVELAGNLPYDVQRLAHETWDDVRAGGQGGAARGPARHADAAARPNRTPCSRRSGSG